MTRLPRRTRQTTFATLHSPHPPHLVISTPILPVISTPTPPVISTPILPVIATPILPVIATPILPVIATNEVRRNLSAPHPPPPPCHFDERSEEKSFRPPHPPSHPVISTNNVRRNLVSSCSHVTHPKKDRGPAHAIMPREPDPGNPRSTHQVTSADEPTRRPAGPGQARTAGRHQPFAWRIHPE